MKNSEVTTASASLGDEAGVATALVEVLTFAIAIQLGAGFAGNFQRLRVVLEPPTSYHRTEKGIGVLDFLQE
jgi:hypothetical protein